MKKNEKKNKGLFGSISYKLKQVSDYPDDSIKMILDGAEEDLDNIKERYESGIKFIILCISLILLLAFALGSSYLYIKDLERSFQELSDSFSKRDSINSKLIDLYKERDSIGVVRDGKRLDYFDLLQENRKLEDSLFRVREQLNLATDAYDLKFRKYKKNGTMYISVTSKYLEKITNGEVEIVRDSID